MSNRVIYDALRLNDVIVKCGCGAAAIVFELRTYAKSIKNIGLDRVLQMADSTCQKCRRLEKRR